MTASTTIRRACRLRAAAQLLAFAAALAFDAGLHRQPLEESSVAQAVGFKDLHAQHELTCPASELLR